MTEAIKIRVERIYRIDGEGILKGIADISVGDTFLIKGLRIVQGKDGLFVAMPRQRGTDGNWYDTIYLLKKETREQLTDIVLSAYEE